MGHSGGMGMDESECAEALMESRVQGVHGKCPRSWEDFPVVKHFMCAFWAYGLSWFCMTKSPGHELWVCLDRANSKRDLLIYYP